MTDIPLTADLEGEAVELPAPLDRTTSGTVVGPVDVREVLWPFATAPRSTALSMPISVVVMRSASRRKCSSCHRRRIVYWLEATSGWHGSSRQLCSICSGLLVHGGRHTDEEIAP